MRFKMKTVAAALAGALLFASPSAEVAFADSAATETTAALRRLTQEQYKTIIADIFGEDIKVGGRFEPDIRKAGLLAIGSGEVTVTPAGFEQYDAMARVIAAQVVDEKHRGVLINCQPKSAKAADSACAERFLKDVGRLLYRRPLTRAELAAQVAVADAGATKLNNFYDGLAMGLVGLLDGAPFLFRTETFKPGTTELDGYSKASRLSFFLWNAGPDQELLRAAEEGELDSARGLSRQVDRLITSPRMEDGVKAFFSDMFGFEAFGGIAKDSIIYPKFSAGVLSDAREQALRTIVEVLIRRETDYRDLFTTDVTFLTPTLAAIYRVPAAGGDWQAYELGANTQRAGWLTQTGFLALHSHPGRSSPTLRGKALREIFLCQRVPDPPGNVDFNIVQDTANPEFRTARARLAAHTATPVCAGCHKLIDPIGLALENFDSIGEFRTGENGTHIDASGELDGKPFKDAKGLGQAVHDNPATTSCLVNRMYSYGTGRAVDLKEREAVKELLAGFAKDGYRVPDLMRRIATDKAFYRVALTANKP